MTLTDDNTTTINEEGARALYDACRTAFVVLLDIRTDELLAISSACQGISLVNLLTTLREAIDKAEIGERRAPRVLIEVYQGCASYEADAGVNVALIDYDAGKTIPEAFADMGRRKQ